MFQRFHEMRERGERGFTLIELLVVILIIAILAAIAIPVFLNQRKKGWVSQMESSLKNAATAMETCATENNGDYTGCDPAAHGYNATTDVGIAVTSADATGFLLTATHTLHEDDYQYDSDVGAPEVVAVP